ncbi:MAG: hybrid sensor histidine kinase/response regulator [Actinobacteria bacterium]|nr:MAG: hybrid sensor histidine kinase/response regulator [Actinomycetota bacterium]
MVILGILQNIALLIMLSALLQLIIRRWTTDSVARRLFTGLLYGAITIVGMVTPFTIVPGVFFDGRSIILAVAGLFGGPLTVTVAALIALAYRLYLGGAGVVMGSLVIVESAVLGAVFHELRRRRLPVMRYRYLWVFGLLVHAVMLALTLTLPDGLGPSVARQIALPVLTLYPLGLVLVSRLLLDQEQRHLDEVALRRLNESLEAQVAERTRALEAANERLASESDAKTRFLRSMSHELRTPLNSIIGFSDILGKGMAGELNEEQQRQIEMIGGAGKHLLALINDILDLSRIEANAVKVERDEIDVRALVDEVVATLVPEVTAKGIGFASEFESDDMAMLTDARKLSQILLNLTSNAVKYTQHGAVTLRVHQTGNTVTFSVEDTGPGISEELLESIFSEFTRGERTPDQSAEGTGLGLAISRGLAEMLGGRIEVQSEVGRGSIFTLLLPARP